MIRAAILNRARELGFDDCRICAAGPPPHAEAYQAWIAKGWHGSMSYLERTRAKRVDPQQVLPGVRSLILVAINYGTANDQAGSPARPAIEAGRTTGRVARYATYADYHDQIGRRLAELSALVDQVGGSGTRSLWYVDTGPVLERDWAQLAGLGFVGKHTHLIHRRWGNWCLLGEILTTLELAPDVPERNHCGRCTKCLEICPTQAFPAPFQLDARRCISYLTIEHRGSIPLEFRRAMGDRVFGCDDCLEVCPWNRFAQAGRLLQSHARPDLASPDLLELAELDESEFKRRFGDTPIARCKWAGLLRNVCVALGNVGDSSAAPVLKRLASHPNSLVTEHAQWALGEIARRDPAVQLDGS